MNEKDKKLLLKDLCARLPYNVIINCTEEDNEKTNFDCFLSADMIKDIKSGTEYWIIKPYLRQISSMTEKEKYEIQGILGKDVEIFDDFINIIDSSRKRFSFLELQAVFDWLNVHHFDYLGLIEKNLAIEVTNENNLYK